MSEGVQVFVAGTLYTPEEVAGPVAVVIEGTKIRAVWRETDVLGARQLVEERMPGTQVEVRDLTSWRLAPGYIDIHMHGFAGHDVTGGSSEDITAIAQELPSTGVTSFFPTVATTGKAETARQVRRIVISAEQQGNDPCAEILGIRLEGPFISKAKKGAQYEAAIRPPDPAELSELAHLGNGWLKIIDFAPEEDREDRFLAAVVEHNILPCIGHTAATYEQALHALDGGARHSTHLFNTMPPLDHRAPGVAGALLTDTRATVEVIADGIHVHPALLKLAVAARGPDSVALITDCVIAAGLPDGEYDFVGRKIQVKEGAVRLASGALAGSTLVLDRAVRNMVAFAGIRWPDAIRMASLTPARIIGIDARKGRIAPGADADLVALDAAGHVMCTWTRGQLAFTGK